jgi:hypothetical protein
MNFIFLGPEHIVEFGNFAAPAFWAGGAVIVAWQDDGSGTRRQDQDSIAQGECESVRDDLQAGETGPAVAEGCRTGSDRVSRRHE